ncbi:MAG TPA: hypothetical protein VLT36_11010 [Candidatus Dormibacteraeota bacterium]|nr:hypothetical protein [Candidatus Dormibacteraeota bacterium]
MTNRRRFLAVAHVVALVCTATSVMAQNTTNAITDAKRTKAEKEEPPPYRAWTVGIGIGTDTLLGGGVSWRFSDHFGTRVGFGYTESDWDAVRIGGLKYNVTARLLSEPITLDIYPWQKSSFHLSVGMLVNQSELTGSVSTTGSINVGGEPVEVNPREISIKIQPQPVNPYLSIGGNFFYFDRAHHWAMYGELGVAYTGDTKVSLDRTRDSSISDETVNKVKDRLRNYGDQFQWWPVLKLAVTYSF